MKSVRATVAEAMEYQLSCWPPREDGTKAPEGSWKEFTLRRPTRDELTAVYARDRHGVGLVCGAVSGGLECLDIEDQATWDLFVAALDDGGLIDLGREVARGYMERTPSGGVHWLWLAEEAQGNQKLALSADGKVRIETRGEGGYAIIAPSHGPIHPSGRAWELAHGGLSSIRQVSADEREALLTLCRNLDEGGHWRPREPQRTVYEDQGRPGDDFNRRGDWARDVLEPAGWTKVGQIRTQEYWRRPGKDQGHSAVLHTDTGVLVPFSSSVPLEPERGHTKFGALAGLVYGGDYSAAARELRKKGYGAEREEAPQEGPRPILYTPQILAYAIPEVATLPVLGRPGFIQKGGANLIYSYPKLGKTELLAALAKEWAGAGERVLVLSEEGPANWKLRLVAHGYGTEEDRFGVVPASGCSVAETLRLVEALPHDVLVVDTLRSTTGYIEAEGDKEVARVVLPLIAACQKNGSTLVVLYHARKMPGEGGRDISGHHSLYGAFDRAIQLREVEGHETYRRVTVSGRCLYEGDNTLVYAQVAPGQFRVLDGQTVVEEASRKLHVKECHSCGADFEAERHTAKFCSPLCRLRAFKNRGGGGDSE